MKGFKKLKTDKKMKTCQQKLLLQGTKVYFPYKPYEEQKKYMEKVIEALGNNNNALLESPTGTGKTLSLLCSSLGWLKKSRKRSQVSNSPPSILYFSRTHSQLNQVLGELKKTIYRPNVSLIKARIHCCINKEISQSDPGRIDNLCKYACTKGL